MPTARALPDAAPIPPSEQVGCDRRALRRVVEEHVAEVHDKLEQIAALIACGELDARGPGGTRPDAERYARLLDALGGCLPALGCFLDDVA